MDGHITRFREEAQKLELICMSLGVKKLKEICHSDFSGFSKTASN